MATAGSPPANRREIHVLADRPSLIEACATRILAVGRAAILLRGSFHLALAGGNTPRELYQRLAAHDYASHLDWDRVHLYFGDERGVPPDHRDSNYRMVRESLLDHIPIPAGNVHRIAAEQPPERAAELYAGELARHAPASPHGPALDLVLLGLGPDGHVASLFPHTAALEERERSVVAVNVEQLQSWRITLTFPVLENAAHLLLLVSGAEKAPVVAQALSSQIPPPLPVQRLRPRGEVEWFMDVDAASAWQGGRP